MAVGLATLVVATPIAGAAPSEPEIPSKLALSEAVSIFRAHGLDLVIAEAQVDSAAGDARAAAAIPNPSVSGAFYRSFFQDGLFETPNGWAVGIGDSNAIEDTLSGKRGLRMSVAQAALAAARLQRTDAQRTLELQVKQQYLQAVLAGASLVFTRQVAESIGRTLDLVRIRYGHGAVSEVDVARTETAKLEADGAVDRAAQASREAKVNVAFLLGRRRSFVDFEIAANQLKFFTPAALTGITAAQLIDRALMTRPDLGAQEHQRERASRAVALAKRGRFPDIAAGIQYQEQGSGSTAVGAASAITPPTIELGLSATLPLFYQQQGEIKKAQADLAIQEAQLSKVRAQIVADVETAYGAYQTSRAMVERAEGRLLAQAARARDLVTIQYEKGAASLIEYLDAQRTFIAVNVEYLQNLTAYWSAIFQLETATAIELGPP